MERENKTPIKRVDFFYSEEDFNLDMDLASEYINNDVNFKVTLYRIDLTNTTTNVYGETKATNIVYHEPIELNVYGLSIEPSDAKTLAGGKIKYNDFGNLKFTISTHEFTKKDVDVKQGDIVAYNISESLTKFFEVVDDGRMVYSSQQMFNGYKSIYRDIACVHKDITQFNGR